ncbi:hypothetical protein HID58_035500 [Brassica napus]|nr:hypothetical protein HID58_035500 [Brassica napus]
MKLTRGNLKEVSYLCTHKSQEACLLAFMEKLSNCGSYSKNQLAFAFMDKCPDHGDPTGLLIDAGMELISSFVQEISVDESR